MTITWSIAHGDHNLSIIFGTLSCLSVVVTFFTIISASFLWCTAVFYYALATLAFIGSDVIFLVLVVTKTDRFGANPTDNSWGKEAILGVIALGINFLTVVLRSISVVHALIFVGVISSGAGRSSTADEKAKTPSCELRSEVSPNGSSSSSDPAEKAEIAIGGVELMTKRQSSRPGYPPPPAGFYYALVPIPKSTHPGGGGSSSDESAKNLESPTPYVPYAAPPDATLLTVQTVVVESDSPSSSSSAAALKKPAGARSQSDIPPPPSDAPTAV